MVFKSFNLVLKKYGKWFLNMCGNPAATSLYQRQCVRAAEVKAALCLRSCVSQQVNPLDGVAFHCTKPFCGLRWSRSTRTVGHLSLFSHLGEIIFL